LEPAIESLRADGIEPDPITDISKHIPGNRVVFFRNPEGNLIEFIEGYRDGALFPTLGNEASLG
jgi:hypothetical protein